MFKDERKATYLNPEGADKPLKSPLPQSTIEAARDYRLGRFREQMALLAERPDPLIERDVVIIVDTDPGARSAIRTELRPRGFAIVVMQKDGTVGFRRPSPRDVREIIRGIDNFSFRQEELRTGG